MSSSPIDRRVAEQRVGDVIAGFPDAEDVLEQAGVDYWFGLDEMLGAACEAAHADQGEIASRLAACHPGAHNDSTPATLAALLRESNEQWSERLAPAIERAISIAGTRSQAVSRLLQELKKRLEIHMATSRSLLPAAEAIERGEAGVLHPKTLRTLRLEHLDLARIARDLRAYASEANGADLTDALRSVIRGVHHHLMVAYNFILPRLVTAAVARPVVCEPW
jgi:iron-sulfur cluster repair protein YtfE (RIC family)